MRKLNIMPFVLVLVILFLAAGCSSNESKAEKLVDAADGEYLQGNLNYESVISSYMEAYHLVNYDAYKDRIVDLINEQNTLISVRECLVSLDELSKNIKDTVDGYGFDDIEELNAYIRKTESEIMTVLDYLSQLECNSTKINGYISDVISSNEYYEIITGLKDIDYPILAERLYDLAHLYDFPDSFKPYSISDEEFRLFGLSERLSLEMFSRERTLTGNYDIAYTENSLIIEGRDFSDGVVWVRFASNWACMDKTGTVLFELDTGSEPTTDFRDGMAIVDRRKIVTSSGEIISSVSDGEYDEILLSYSDTGRYYSNISPNDGVVFVLKHIDTFEVTEDRIGAINLNGEWVMGLTNSIDIKFLDYLGDSMWRLNQTTFWNQQTGSIFEWEGLPVGLHFSDGVAIAATVDWESHKVYSLSKDGTQTRIYPIFNGRASSVTVTANGLYSDSLFYGYQYINNGIMGGIQKRIGNFYDKDGNTIIDFSNTTVNNEPSFHEGYCLIDMENQQGSRWFSVMDINGNMVFEPIKIEKHGGLNDGLYWTMENGIYTYRNVQGTAVFTLPEHIETAYDFNEGLLRVESPSNTYYVDTNGNTVFGSAGEMPSVASYDGDNESLNKFLTFLVEKEGQMYNIEPLEFDAHNCDLNELLEFAFVKMAWITSTNDDFVKEYRATASDMYTLAKSIFGIDVSEYVDANIAVSNGWLEYVYDSRSPYYYQTIEWGARGTCDTWAETESVVENGDGSLTVIAGIYSSVNPDEWKDLNRKVTAIVIPVDGGYQLLSFKNND